MGLSFISEDSQVPHQQTARFDPINTKSLHRQAWMQR